jgi:hypothetical protein
MTFSVTNNPSSEASLYTDFHKNRIQYAVLVLCLINGNKLSIECLPHECMQEVFNNCRVNRGTSDEDIKDAIYHMSSDLFIKTSNRFIDWISV